jgi:hypothetical protein
MFQALARSTRIAAPRVRTMAAPRRTPAPSADAFSKNWLQDPGTYPIVVTVTFACLVASYKIFHDARSPEAHFSKTERGSIDYIENSRTEDAAKNWTSHRTLHKAA